MEARMIPETCFSQALRQRGEALIEALLGVLLMAVIGLGLSYAASRAVLGQRYLNTQNVVVTQMREAVTKAGSISSLCDAGSGPVIQVAGKQTTLHINCQHQSVTVATLSAGGTGSASSLTATLPNSVLTSLSLSTPTDDEGAKALVGGDGKIEVSL